MADLAASLLHLGTSVLNNKMQHTASFLTAAAAAAAAATTTLTENMSSGNYSNLGDNSSNAKISCNTNGNGHPAESSKARLEMYERFQSWASQNYGETGKTKTVTRRKYDRIVRILSGQEQANSENSKFRFWVKAKGFRLGPPPVDEPNIAEQVLYVPSKTVGLGEGEEKEYKRVAKVEDFFDIIYNVHVEMDGRGGKHAGQKRTYRAVAETYSFLPREAVTRFLMSCSDCQKRMHLTMETNNNNTPTSHQSHHSNASHVTNDPPIIDFSLPITTTYLNHLKSKKELDERCGAGVATVSRGPYVDDTFAYHIRDEDSMSESSSVSQQASKENSPSPRPVADSSSGSGANPNSSTNSTSTGGPTTDSSSPQSTAQTPNKDLVKSPAAGAVGSTSNNTTTTTSRGASPAPVTNPPKTDVKREDGYTMTDHHNGTSVPAKDSSEKSSPNVSGATTVKSEERVPPPTESRKRRASNDSLEVRNADRKRRASNESLDSSTKTSECAVDESRDDEDENEDDEEDKLLSKDPEKLKAFNMFVRLFVDENLDRSVPISKQPKDKIQAILEACDRQFPEFHERARKRVRTYLKSCRRMRRSKDGNGWDQLRPTPPHLTSAAAEALLSLACENESNNAKRMRMGLEPLPASAMTSTSTNTSSSNGVATPASVPQSQHSPSQPIGASSQPATQNAASVGSSSPSPTPAHAHTPAHGYSPQPPPPPPPSSSAERNTPSAGHGAVSGESYLRSHGASQPTAFRPPHELSSPFFAGTNGLFRPGFPNSYQHPAHHHSPVLQHTSLLQNGPTDLSMKKSPNTSSKSQLNPSEVATIKQLIAGYRESAAFLYRSADELEQLLLQQN